MRSNLLVKGEPGTGKTRLIHHLIKDCKKVVWISTLKSAEKVRSEFSRSLDLYIVDTHTWQRRPAHTERDVVIKNPMNLNDVSLAINKTIEMAGKNFCLVFDSLSGLLLYHKVGSLIHLLRGMLVKLENVDGSGIFALTKNAHKLNVEVSLSMIFDNVIELEREYSSNGVKRSINIIKVSRYLSYSQVDFRIEREGIVFDSPIDRELRDILGI